MNASYIIDRDPSGELEIIFAGETLPTNEGWTVTGNISRASIDDDELIIDESQADTCYFDKVMPTMDASGTVKFNLNFKFTNASTEFYFKVASSVLGVAFHGSISGGTLTLTTSGTDITASVSVDTWYHLQVKLSSSSISAVLDNVTMTNSPQTPYASSDDFIRFGKTTASAVSGNIHINHLLAGFPVNHREGRNKLASSGASLTCAQATSNFPISNITNRRANNPVLMTTNTGIVIDIDFGESTECKVISILGHNFTTGALIKLENDDNAAQSSPDLTHMVVWNKRNIHIILTANYTNRYWRLSISDPDNSENVLIGEMIMGNAIEFGENFNWGVNHEKEMKDIELETEFGQKWNYHLSDIDIVSGLSFKMINDDTVEELMTFFDDCKGSHYPILLIWDGDIRLQDSVYGHLTNKLKHKLRFLSNNDITNLKLVGLPAPKTLDDDVNE